MTPTTGGEHTPTGPPVAYGPSPVTQQYSQTPDLRNPPAQWGDQNPGDDGVRELFLSCTRSVCT